MLALASFGAFLVACRGLLGIDDDAQLRGEDGGPSNEDAAGDGAPGPDGLTEGGIGMDGGGGPAVPVDRRYAQWRLPPIMPVLLQYDLQPDTVTDKITGLVWQRLEANQTTMSFPAGIAYCEDLTIGGQSDWRLPTRIEFLSILDYGRTSGGLLNATVFPNAASASATSGTWTASLSLLRAKLVDHLVVDSFAGNVQVNDIGQSSLIVRCVRDGPTTSPVQRYVLGSGIASDVLTPLTWQLVPMATTRTLAVATSACAGLALGGVAA